MERGDGSFTRRMILRVFILGGMPSTHIPPLFECWCCCMLFKLFCRSFHVIDVLGSGGRNTNCESLFYELTEKCIPARQATNWPQMMLKMRPSIELQSAYLSNCGNLVWFVASSVGSLPLKGRTPPSCSAPSGALKWAPTRIPFTADCHYSCNPQLAWSQNLWVVRIWSRQLNRWSN